MASAKTNAAPVIPAKRRVRPRSLGLHTTTRTVAAAKPSSSDTPSPSEDGVVCALRARVPVLVAGGGAPNPYATFGGTEVAATGLANAIAEVVPVEARDRRRFKKLMEESKSFESLPIRTRLTDEEVARILEVVALIAAHTPESLPKRPTIDIVQR